MREKHHAQRFAVLCMARSGSNLLSSLLNSHPRIFAHGELFHAQAIQGPVGRSYDFPALEARIGGNLSAFRDADPLRFLELALEIPFDAVGFKLFLNHSERVLNHLIDCDRYVLIVLNRVNRLAAYSSALIGAQNQIWHSTQVMPSHRIKFVEAEFHRRRHFADAHYTALHERLEGRPSVIHLEYRQLGEIQIHSEILTYLGVDPTHQLTSRLVKQNPPEPLARFTNPDDVLRVLEQMGHLDWAKEG